MSNARKVRIAQIDKEIARRYRAGKTDGVEILWSELERLEAAEVTEEE